MKIALKMVSMMFVNIFTTCCVYQVSSHTMTGHNLALGKSAWQYPGTYDSNAAERAVDGNTDPDVLHGSCAHTAENTNETAFWTVDLEDLYYITSIIIFSRKSTYNRRRLRKFKVYGYPGNVTLYDDATEIIPQYNKTVIIIPVDSGQAFRNITVYLPTVEKMETILTLCEVQIFGGLPSNTDATKQLDGYLTGGGIVIHSLTLLLLIIVIGHSICLCALKRMYKRLSEQSSINMDLAARPTSVNQDAVYIEL